MPQLINSVIFIAATIQSLVKLSLGQVMVTPHPNDDYLRLMCYPLLSNATRTRELQLTIANLVTSLANSPFPCEQEAYILAVCSANGTTPIDFLAEQECLCPSSYWLATSACADCYFAHGDLNDTREGIQSMISSRSSRECDVTTPPIQPYTNLFPSVNLTAEATQADVVIGTDKFPNQTALSNYFTSTGSNLWTTGSITGSATARLTSFTNTAGVRFTPTATSGSVSSANGTASASAASNATTSSAGVRPKRAHMGLLVGILGLIVWL